jgi:aspartate/glutamate racemase
MKRKVAVIHTSFVSVNDLKALFREFIPEVEMINIVDDSLLPEVMANGAITPAVVRRMSRYARQAEELGAELILNQCSSVGEAVDQIRPAIQIPYLKVDEPMAEEAVRLGRKIAVVATVASTMGPSVRLVQAAARKAGREVEVIECLVDGALDILMKEGNREKHNRLVKEKIESVAGQVDVIVLAQGSMIVLLPELGHIPIPVLTSPALGVQRLREVLALGRPPLNGR